MNHHLERVYRKRGRKRTVPTTIVRTARVTRSSRQEGELSSEERDEQSNTNYTLYEADLEENSHRLGKKEQKIIEEEENSAWQSHCPLVQEVDFEILRFMKSFFKSSDITNECVLEGKRLLMEHVHKLVSISIAKFVVTRNKSSNFTSAQILKIIERFDEKYKNKIVRTFIMQEIEKQSKSGESFI